MKEQQAAAHPALLWWCPSSVPAFLAYRGRLGYLLAKVLLAPADQLQGRLVSEETLASEPAWLSGQLREHPARAWFQGLAWQATRRTEGSTCEPSGVTQWSVRELC